MTTKKPRKKRVQVAARDSKSLRARVLCEAETSTDVSVGARYGISPETICRWRKSMSDDPELTALYRRLCSEVEERFIVDAAKAFTALATRLTELAPEMSAGEATHALERVGDVLVQARGLGRMTSEEDGDGFAEVDRQGAALTSDSASARSGAVH